MRKYLYLTRLTIMTGLQYKAFFLANLLSLSVRILVGLFVWKTIFLNQSQVKGFTLETFTTYLIFANLLASLNSFSIGQDLSRSILKGTITGELLRPYSFIIGLFFKDLGFKLLETFKFALSLLVVLLLQAHFYLPDLPHFLLFLVSSLLGMFIVQLLDLAFGFLSFFTVNSWGVLILRNGLFNLTSGALLPLSFYPQVVEKFLVFFPYHHAVNLPIAILLGQEEPSQGLLWQSLWIPFLMVLIALLWQEARRRLEIFGG